jgi:hypothetical protein
MFWLTFRTAASVQVIIIEAGHLALARVTAGMLGQKGEFQAGHQLDVKMTKRIPKNMVARTLSRSEAAALLKRIGA